MARVKCRVCKQDVNFQYYKEHLKSRHPGEDEKDLRGFGQPKLFEVSINKKRKLDDNNHNIVEDTTNVKNDDVLVNEKRGVEEEQVGGLEQSHLENLKDILVKEDLFAVEKVNMKLEAVWTNSIWKLIFQHVHLRKKR